MKPLKTTTIESKTVASTERFEEFKITDIEKAKQIIQSYPGNRIDDDYFNLLASECDEKTLKQVLAVAICETSAGRNTRKNSNFWNWFKGGDRGYDPSREVMAKVICEGIKTKYPNLPQGAKSYTAGDSLGDWVYNFNYYHKQM